jgi:hypothetical protein
VAILLWKGSDPSLTPDPAWRVGMFLVMLSAVLVTAVGAVLALFAAAGYPVRRGLPADLAELALRERLATRRSTRLIRAAIPCGLVGALLICVAAGFGWFAPRAAQPTKVVVETDAAQVICGNLVNATGTQVELSVAGKVVVVPMSHLRRLAPVASC